MALQGGGVLVGRRPAAREGCVAAAAGAREPRAPLAPLLRVLAQDVLDRLLHPFLVETLGAGEKRPGVERRVEGEQAAGQQHAADLVEQRPLLLEVVDGIPHQDHVGAFRPDRQAVRGGVHQPDARRPPRRLAGTREQAAAGVGQGRLRQVHADDAGGAAQLAEQKLDHRAGAARQVEDAQAAGVRAAAQAQAPDELPVQLDVRRLPGERVVRRVERPGACGRVVHQLLSAHPTT